MSVGDFFEKYLNPNNRGCSILLLSICAGVPLMIFLAALVMGTISNSNNSSSTDTPTHNETNTISTPAYSYPTTLQDFTNRTSESYYNSCQTTTNRVSNYKYNYKIGRTYNYDISGYDEDGNYVYGNVDIDESGEGYIVDEDGNEKYIEVEWVGYGEMEGYDEDGEYYELGVD